MRILPTGLGDVLARRRPHVALELDENDDQRGIFLITAVVCPRLQLRLWWLRRQLT
jgi:hypothetical protein